MYERDSVGAPTQASAINSGFIDVWSSVPSTSVAAARGCAGARLDDVLCAGSLAVLEELDSRRVTGFRCGGVLRVCACVIGFAL